MLKIIFFLLLTLHFASGLAQNSFEFASSIGANATTSRTVPSHNMTWGYHTPPYPNTWSNHWSAAWGNKINRLSLAYDIGTLGPTWRAYGYTNKFPYDDQPSSSSNPNLSVVTHYQGGAKVNSNLKKLSIQVIHNWTPTRKFHHKSSLGLSFLKTRVVDFSTSTILTFHNDSLGWVSSGMVMDKYEYLRNKNIYLSAGYQLSYKLAKSWYINALFMYNQGLYKMIRWHTYRIYNESLTGYQEFDEQWSFTRLSYFAFLAGVSYEIGVPKKENKP